MRLTDRRAPARPVLGVAGLGRSVLGRSGLGVAAVGLVVALVVVAIALSVGHGRARPGVPEGAVVHPDTTGRHAPRGVTATGATATGATATGVRGHGPSAAEQARSVARAFARLPDTGWIATLRRPTTWSARPGGSPAGRLAATNPYGTPMVLAILGAPRSDGWAEIDLPVRPNGSKGWIRWRDARLARTAYRVEVHLGARRMTVLDGTRRVLTTSVAVGAARTPTPPGSTYLWELVRPTGTGDAYGPFVFGLALYSDAYAVFNGGEAQIGIHGSDEPGLIGEAVSNGCVRLPNATVAELTGLLPLGTPVTITA